MAALVAAPALADPPDISIIPPERPWTRSLPGGAEAAVFLGLAPGLRQSPRPVARPAARDGGQDRQSATAGLGQVSAQDTARWIGGAGRLCGARSIRGKRLDPVNGPGSCGILNPVLVTEVEGVQLSTPATMDCPTALALAEWVRTGVKPSIGTQGGGVAVLRMAGSYSCRTRNNRPGARMSEHARGRALDVSGFQLANGRLISVLKGWRERGTRRLLQKIHRVACGPFSTVLGPGADQYHQGHFHLDTASYRSRAYCR